MPVDHSDRFVAALVRVGLNLPEIIGAYKSALGQPPFDPRLMTALLFYPCCAGFYSSRRITKSCPERVDFMMLVAHDVPDSLTIADFRKLHLARSAPVLAGAEPGAEGWVGQPRSCRARWTKIKANASKRWAMSYERMKAREAE
ncbi:hypothetical protein M2322_004687 [Rhodoblastus acidophilus]|uniref:transposase n=1 Tax=Rhodoblastus acidophilus TaxID=1074 RepID=UPI00222443C9|nr:transposase [Rhodoblastus acidophilus]MCW2319118.1 hypothetical protein [Rhodoblastus acidophilus]